MKKIIPYLLSIILLAVLITTTILNKKELSDLNSEVDSYKKKVEDLTNKTETDMMKVRNLGKKSFDEVTAKLHSLGLDFAKEDE